MFKCPKCGKTVPGDHYCTQQGRVVPVDDSGDFLTSALVAGVTDNAAIGALFGGDIVGAIVGDLFSDGDLF